MTKDVMISIKGMHLYDENGEDDPIEQIVAGKYYCKEGKHQLFYEEASMNQEEILNTRVTITPQSVEFIRKGKYSSSICFFLGEKHINTYHTPMGNLSFGVETENIDIREMSEDRIEIAIEYRLAFNREYETECRVNMIICSKELSAPLF